MERLGRLRAVPRTFVWAYPVYLIGVFGFCLSEVAAWEDLNHLYPLFDQVYHITLSVGAVTFLIACFGGLPIAVIVAAQLHSHSDSVFRFLPLTLIAFTAIGFASFWFSPPNLLGWVVLVAVLVNPVLVALAVVRSEPRERLLRQTLILVSSISVGMIFLLLGLIVCQTLTYHRFDHTLGNGMGLGLVLSGVSTAFVVRAVVRGVVAIAMPPP